MSLSGSHASPQGSVILGFPGQSQNKPSSTILGPQLVAVGVGVRVGEGDGEAAKGILGVEVAVVVTVAVIVLGVLVEVKVRVGIGVTEGVVVRVGEVPGPGVAASTDNVWENPAITARRMTVVNTTIFSRIHLFKPSLL